MVQSSVLHELQHDDDSQHCELCIVAHDFQSTSFQLQEAVTIQFNDVIDHYQQVLDVYEAPTISTVVSFNLSIRPPPAV